MVVWCSVVMECEGGDVAVDGVASWGEGGEAVEVRVVVRRCDSGDGGCGGVTRVTRRRWWCGRCSGDGAVVVVVVMLVEMAWSLAGVRGGAEKGGGAWYSGSGRSGHEDNIWFQPERSPENFSGGGGMVADGEGGRIFGEDGRGRESYKCVSVDDYKNRRIELEKMENLGKMEKMEKRKGLSTIWRRWKCGR
ncbi:hypothetical protein Tco_0952379 [Tanacetum coccineum]|uniref:Uncharacterized protein n=1 Tax=Tanacetum coccineum TaxID=301880 RepID=A0ABQ5E2S6_9ASTR